MITSSAPLSTAYKPHWLRPDFADFALGLINPLWTIGKVVGQIKAIATLPDQMLELTIKPNRFFKKRQLKPGQFVILRVMVNGRFLQRCYSVFDCENGYIKLAIKRQGKVSQALASFKAGDIIELSQPQGDFCLRPTDADQLFIAAGSGITAILPLVKQALHTVTSKDTLQPIRLIYLSRDPALLPEISALQQKFSNFKLDVLNSQECGRIVINEHFLAQYCPNAAKANTYICVNSAISKTLNTLWQERGWQNQLFEEQFLPSTITVSDTANQPIHFARSHHHFNATGTLLESAERAGLNPPSACRMGVCNSCTCHKNSGITQNLLTGQICSDANVPVKLCVSKALSPVEIDL